MAAAESGSGKRIRLKTESYTIRAATRDAPRRARTARLELKRNELMMAALWTLHLFKALNEFLHANLDTEIDKLNKEIAASQEGRIPN